MGKRRAGRHALRRVGWAVAAVAGGVIALAAIVAVAVGPSRIVTAWWGWSDRPTVTALSELRLLAGPGLVGQPRWSPDGKLIAYVEFEVRPSPPRDPDELPAIEESELAAYLTVVAAGGGGVRRVAWLRPPQDPFEGNQFAWRPESRAVVCVENVGTGTARESEGAGRVRTIPVSADEARHSAPLPPRVSAHGARLSTDCLAISPGATEAAVLVSQRVGAKWERSLGVVSLHSGELRVLSGFAGSAQREVAVSDIAWQGERIYFTAEGPRREVGAPNAEGGRVTEPSYEIWSTGQDGRDLWRETSGPNDRYPAPSPRSHDLAFLRDDGLYLRGADGRIRPLVRAERSDAGRGYCAGPVSWSPDGQEVAFTWLGRRSGAPSIWVGRVARPPG